ncbi:MAG: hypothetical protein KTR32_11060 [Granulosicoccus sp.]|nr:hypothetical protein [Granulosicoccus sp.]
MNTQFSILTGRRLCFLLCASTLFVGLWHSAVWAAYERVNKVSIATQLESVQHGTFAGLDYLTLKINEDDAGSLNCSSSVLRLTDESDIERRDNIESLALSAMLSDAPVVIVVPIDGECLNGNPVFTDLYPLPASL